MSWNSIIHYKSWFIKIDSNFLHCLFAVRSCFHLIRDSFCSMPPPLTETVRWWGYRTTPGIMGRRTVRTEWLPGWTVEGYDVQMGQWFISDLNLKKLGTSWWTRWSVREILFKKYREIYLTLKYFQLKYIVLASLNSPNCNVNA